MGGDAIFRTGRKGGLGVGGCGGWFMLAVFGPLPFALIAFTLSRWHEAPVVLTIFYIASFFPLAVLFVIARLITRYALAVGRDGTVEIVYPFKTVRLAPADFAWVTTQAAHLGYNQGMAIRRPDVKFVRADNSIAASVAMHAFSQGQWQDFLAALQHARPEVRIS